MFSSNRNRALFTAKVAGTEKGLVGVEPEFSTCFGAPFLPRHPSVYANLLRDYINKHKVDVWLVNSGWTGGKYGEGRRMPIKATRRLLTAALNGSLKDADQLFAAVKASGRKYMMFETSCFH